MTMQATRIGLERELVLTDSDFATVARVAKALFGLHLEESKRPLIRTRLSRRIRALDLPDFAAYCALIDSPRSDEITHFVSALTTNVSHFYREKHHFEQLESEVLPPLVARARAGGRLRIWSAGCSNGQEPYSIAASILAVCPEAARHDIKILATDIDSSVVRNARQGLYTAEERDAPNEALTRRIFDGTGPAQDGHGLPVRPELKSMITFGVLNLMSTWPFQGPFDAIFCRNVAIYFDPPTRARLWARFVERLAPGGYLFIGHSERVAQHVELGLTPVGITAFQKQTGAPGAPEQSRR